MTVGRRLFFQASVGSQDSATAVSFLSATKSGVTSCISACAK